MSEQEQLEARILAAIMESLIDQKAPESVSGYKIANAVFAALLSPPSVREEPPTCATCNEPIRETEVGWTHFTATDCKWASPAAQTAKEGKR